MGVRFGKVGVRYGKVPTAIYRPPVRFGIKLPATEKYQVGVRNGKPPSAINRPLGRADVWRCLPVNNGNVCDY